jgi:hypothetical protein
MTLAVKDIFVPVAQLAIAPSKRPRIMPDTDARPPTPEAGDELFGAEGDEADPPEDESEILYEEQPNLYYTNKNPRGKPCRECKRLIGTTWKAGNQPRLPRHPGCYCYYQYTYNPIEPEEPRFEFAPRNQARAEPKLL